ncbi:MAG: hypothetical protein ACK2T7_11110, partial [Anaerolineales bacterium]
MNRIEVILEKQRSWQALSDDDPAIQSVALDALSGCADALSVLGANLRKIGYHWVTTESIPALTVERNVQTIESRIGMSVPLILVVFWERIGGVSFVDMEQ